MDKIKLGIIGFGNMGVTHSRNITSGITKNFELVAICDTDPDRLKKVNEDYPDVKTFDNAEDMYKSGLIEAVLIAVPHYDHPPLAVKAFEYGLHVMCEKPAGVYTKQVAEMNEAAKKSGKVFGIMFQQRTRPHHVKLKELIESGELGKIKKVIWIVTEWYRSEIYHQSASWRSTWAGEGGAVIMNQSPHNLDLWQWLFGVPDYLTAFCSWGKYYNIECEDDVYAFGEGLSYTEFAYDNFRCNKTAEAFEITFDIHNNGKFDGFEIAQCYIQDVVASMARPIKELKAFQKILIKQGETKTVTMRLTREDLTFYDGRGNKVFEPGDFKLEIGTSSRHSCFTITEYLDFN